MVHNAHCLQPGELVRTTTSTYFSVNPVLLKAHTTTAKVSHYHTSLISSPSPWCVTTIATPLLMAESQRRCLQRPSATWAVCLSPLPIESALQKKGHCNHCMYTTTTSTQCKPTTHNIVTYCHTYNWYTLPCILLGLVFSMQACIISYIETVKTLVYGCC